MEDIKLSKIPEILRKKTDGKVNLTYQQAHAAAVSGSISGGYQNDTGRWYVRSAAVPEIINDFSLKAEQEDLENKIERRAKELDVPVIPKLQPTGPYDPNPVISICGECGLELTKVMSYSCPRANCPCFAKASFEAPTFKISTTKVEMNND